ncbi:hypothetical protein QJS10_CPA05g01953 [Acorus calamus]|uniref:Trichome birefringence-like N-terminal domain-containing protein n=1 Tax=Acorus calamus TaxID=4465 RepID=A0AAV9EVP5_ACOCL|nr:hypothetical protein QJS10_CPA05g01953 [Acorus calamus]
MKKGQHHQDPPLKQPHSTLPNTTRPITVLALPVTLILITTSCLYYLPLLTLPTSFFTPSSPPPQRSDDTNVVRSTKKKCDIFTGEWVPNPQRPPPYTNNSCWAIHEHQNCMKFGRPDSDYLRWRWKPDGCELPAFNPGQFLALVQGKSLAFIGDSIGRNQMQSLMCLLSRVTYPELISETVLKDQIIASWHYPAFNFTLANFWSPYLLLGSEADPNSTSPTSLYHLHLNHPDPSWTAHAARFDYLIFSAGHWFFRPLMSYHPNNTTATPISVNDAYRIAFRTAFSALNEGRFKGMAFLRTYSPAHFEGGAWNDGGDCVRRRPFRENETRLEGYELEMYMIQLEEFRAAERVGRRRGVRFRLLDVTGPMLLRPDGHPGRYGHPKNVTKYNDCVHWCLPGPVDVWNGFLLHMLKMDNGRGGRTRV